MYKNKLQEYCQKNKLDLPIYITNLVNEKYFISEASITLDDVTLAAEGYVKSKKKEAEMTSAMNLLHKLNKYLESNKITFTSKNLTYILIDLENVNINDLFHKYKFNNYIFDVFVSNEDHLKKLGDRRRISTNSVNYYLITNQTINELISIHTLKLLSLI